MIAGAILVLSGTISASMGFMLESADWFGHRESPAFLQIAGAVLFVVGIGVFVWGIVKDHTNQQ